MHVHTDNCLPIFSPEDFLTLEELYYANKNANNPFLAETFSYAVVANSGSGSTSPDVYMMVIENSAAFESFCAAHLNDPLLVEDLNKLYRFKFNIKRTNTTATNELEYLKFLKRVGAGVRILKANSDLTGYNLLTLNRDGTAVIETPCI